MQIVETVSPQLQMLAGEPIVTSIL